MGSVFEIIAEPSRRAILSMLISSRPSAGQIERQLHLPQPGVSRHLRVLRDAGFVESTVDAQLAPFRQFWPAHLDALRTPPRPHGGAGSVRKKGRKKMTAREQYRPGPAGGAQVRKDGEQWTLILVRELRHRPEKVWRALTDPVQLRQWAPFDADRSLDTVGTVTLTTVGMPQTAASETRVSRADAPRLLEYNWWGKEIRWELEPSGDGTRLTLWHNLDRGHIAMVAAGWHICCDVLDRLLGGDPIGRIAGGEAMQFDWQRLSAEYARQFGVEPAAPPIGSEK